MLGSVVGDIRRPTVDYKAPGNLLNTVHRVIGTPRRVPFIGHNPRDSEKLRKLQQSMAYMPKSSMQARRRKSPRFCCLCATKLPRWHLLDPVVANLHHFVGGKTIFGGNGVLKFIV